jgi:hypothetical protein
MESGELGIQESPSLVEKGKSKSRLKHDYDDGREIRAEE